MRNHRLQLRLRLSAAALLLLFVFGWAAVPAALARPQLHGCTMECCEEEGFCCCVEARREALEALSDADQLPQITQLTKRCGSDCATTPSTSTVTSLVKPLQTIRINSLAQTQMCIYQSRIEYQEYLRLKESSPRAPPLFS